MKILVLTAENRRSREDFDEILSYLTSTDEIYTDNSELSIFLLTNGLKSTTVPAMIRRSRQDRQRIYETLDFAVAAVDPQRGLNTDKSIEKIINEMNGKVQMRII